MAKKQIIVPQILKGTREFGPEEMQKRSSVMQKMIEVFARFGYAAIETPILNPAETILGKYGEEGDRLTYAWEDNGGLRIALPYDLTVPVARFVAANWRTLSLPFKQYMIQRVWRAEKPQKGRLREFYQCELNVIGTRSLMADAEIAKVAAEVFCAVGLPDVVIRVNSRRLLDAVLDKFSVPQEKKIEVIRNIDKLDKAGREKVTEALRQEGIKNSEELMTLLEPAESNEETMKKFLAFDLSELNEFFSLCREYAIPEEMLQFDPSLARGLDYYTGIVYEVVEKGKEGGALCAGGRFDDLCSMFSEQPFPGVGVAFGFERMMLSLEERGLLNNSAGSTRVMVANFGKETEAGCIGMLNELTQNGISAEMYLEASKLEKQMKYADKKRIPFVVMCGSDELAKGEVKIKIMATRKQKSIPQNQLVSYLNGYSSR